MWLFIRPAVNQEWTTPTPWVNRWVPLCGARAPRTAVFCPDTELK